MQESKIFGRDMTVVMVPSEIIMSFLLYKILIPYPKLRRTGEEGKKIEFQWC